MACHFFVNILKWRTQGLYGLHARGEFAQALSFSASLRSALAGVYRHAVGRLTQLL